MKKISAIVYTTNTGYTKKYAELLSKHTGLPLYSLKDATKLSKGEPIIYLGWLMAGVIKGYKRASKSFTVSAVCGVGMGESGSISEMSGKPFAVSHFDTALPLTPIILASSF